MKILILACTYNEKENLEKLIREILNLRIKNSQILIIDDNSPDGTGKIADQLALKYKNIKAIHRLKKLGLGSAYQVAFKYVLKNHYDYLVTLDADFSHPPKSIPKMLEKTENADLVIGSRYIAGGEVKGVGFFKKFLSRSSCWISQIIFGLKTKDSTSGFRIYSRNFIETLKDKKIISTHFAFQLEMVYYGEKEGLVITEYPIIYQNRKEGKSKANFKEFWESAKAFLELLKLKFFKKFKKGF